jgi:asparagine synthase (glutamine-hydrolysing)
MCGITGFVGQGCLDDLEKMSRRVSHRGPDDEGVWYDPEKGLYLAHKRLSIIDLTDGKQPMWTSDEEVGVIFNGEIYNHVTIRKSLEKEGYQFQTDHSDTEVLLYGYKKWGNELPLYLKGMWAFVIYDRKRHILFLSRDPFGKKPLYYTFQNNIFAFGSELSVFEEHSKINATVSITSLKKYFAYGYIPAPGSLYTGIFKLPGGHNLIFDLKSSSIKKWKYWEFVIDPFETIPKNPDEEWGEQLRDLLRRAVKRRFMSDVPLGVFLSGGIDSSSIAAVAAQSIGKDQVKTFCVGFYDDSFDESKYSEYAASTLGISHTLKMLSLKTARETLPNMIKLLDEPLGDSSLLPTYLLCKEAKKYVTVALGGDGADELFAGYDPFHALKLAEIYKAIVPNSVHKGIRMLAARLPVSHRNISLDFKIKQTLRALSYPEKLWNPIWLGPLEPAELKLFFNDPIDLEDVYSEAIECWDRCNQESLIDRTLQFYTDIYLQNDILTKIDRTGMLNALEVRAPYLDIDLVEFVRRIPGSFKYRFGQTKYILKKALTNILPKEILYRKKHGFGMPVGRWFMDESFKKEKDSFFPFLNGKFYMEKNKEQIRGQDDHRLFLWSSYVLNYFNKKSALSGYESELLQTVKKYKYV